MTNRGSLALVVGAGLVFALWQVIAHVLMMELDMVAYHVVQFAVETTLASVAIVGAAQLGARARLEREKAEQLAAITAAALASEELVGNPVAGLLEALEQARQEACGVPAVEHTLERAARTARRIQVANQGLKRVLAPFTGP